MKEVYTALAARAMMVEMAKISRRTGDTYRQRVQAYADNIVARNRELSATLAVLSFCEGQYTMARSPVA